jgi:2-C-methyl-D-erythritol 4-phosphate cytidylyltransferase
MNSAVIVAAGSSRRMGPGTDKLFLEVNGLPLVAHTWRRFDASSRIDEIVLVIRSGLEKAFLEIAERIRPGKPYRLVAGGAERQESVWNGLNAVDPRCRIVAIQDGARACTSEAVIVSTIARAVEMGAAVAAQRVTDTLKESDGENRIQRTVDRTHLWAVQTPQVFRIEVIRKALQSVREKGLSITDDTAACESIGQPVALVESRDPNPKATDPGDLSFIASLLGSEGDA